MFRSFRFRRTRECRLTGLIMGTTYMVKYLAGRGSPEPAGLQQRIDGCLHGLVSRMSPYAPDSELSRFNRHPDDSPFPLSAETFEVFHRAFQIADESGGAFDITVAPVVKAYGFGPDPFRVTPPSEEDLDLLRQRVGYRMLELDPVAATVRKARADLECDLSGIAKGYGVDRVAAVLDGSGLKNYLVEIGGEVRARGQNADGQPWRIAIERPAAGERTVHRVVGLTDRSIATSGDYRIFYLRDGKRISHTIDPRTGRPVEHDLASVTVARPDCAEADAWATAFMVLGPEQGLALAEQKRLAALFLIRKSEGAITEKATSAFRPMTS